MSRLNANAAFNDASNNILSSTEVDGQDLSRVPWPEHPLYGHDHAKWTSKLAERILQSVFEQRGLPAPTPQEMLVIKGAALFHDLGRGLKADQNWRVAEPGHQQRSADIAARVLMADEFWRNHQNTHRQICQIISTHKLPPLTGAGSLITGSDVQRVLADPFLTALWDAECLESSRFEPRTDTGLQLTRVRFNQVLSAWAKLPEHRQRWRNERWRRA